MYLQRAIRLTSLLLLALPTRGATDPPPSYPLLCRGGGAMRLELHGARDGTLLFLHFDRAELPVSQRRPAAGTCGWVDRVLNDDEPTTMWDMAHMSYANVLFGTDGRLQAIGYQPQGDADSLARVRHLIDEARNGREFTVHVRRQDLPSRRVFAIERLGP